MKPNLLTNFLAGAFLLSAIGVLVFSGWYLFSMRQLEKFHPFFLGVNHNRVVIRSLVVDAMEYRKRNPAIEPVLKSVSLLNPALATNAPQRSVLP